MNINKQIAIKGAELLWPEPEHVIYADNSVVAVSVLHGTDGELNTIFDPANDANDMNKLIQALKIMVNPMKDGWWGADLWTDYNEGQYYSESLSRDEAIRECVIKALGIGVDND